MQHKWLSKESRHSRNSTFAMFLLFMTYMCSEGEDIVRRICNTFIKYRHMCVCISLISPPRILNKLRSDHKRNKGEHLTYIRRASKDCKMAIILPWCSRVQLNIANMLWLSSLVASACCVGSWTYKNRPVQVVSVTCLSAHPREAIQAKGINAIGRVFKTCLKHSYWNMKFTFSDDFLDGHLMSSNSKHSSDEAATAAGTSAPSTDSWARPGAHQLPAWIKKFLHFPRG